MGVEVLLVMGGQAQTLEASALSVELRLLHQNPTVALPPLLFGHNYRLYKQAAAVTHDQGEPGVAEEPLLCPSGALQENQADGELRAGLLEGVDPGCLAPPPLGVDQVRAGYQQVRTPVDRNRTDPPCFLSVVVFAILNVSIQQRDFFSVM